MDRKDRDIGKQLKMVFSSLIFVVAMMSLLTVWQGNQLSKQTQTLYEHPLQVRRALDNIKVDQQMMGVAIRDMVLAENDVDENRAYERLLRYGANIPTEIDILRSLYLGPTRDIEAITTEYAIWEEVVMRNAVALLEGDDSGVIRNMQINGEIAIHSRMLEQALNTVDAFAEEKADELYHTSESGRRSITLTTFSITAILILAMFMISKRIYGNIQGPLGHLVHVVGKVQDGDLQTRSAITVNNEFGKLGHGLNSMLDSIETGVKLNEKGAVLSRIMLEDDNMTPFFQSLLAGLLKQTDGQLGAIYLLSDDASCYDLFVSIGMDDKKRMSFNRDSLEGELGLAASSQEIQVLRNINEHSRFVFSASAGNLIPKELIAIPLVNQNEIFAFVAIGSVVGFSELTQDLLDKIRTVMSTRMRSVLDLQEIKRIKEQLENQNRELEAQKSELDTLSVELGEQNRELEMQKLELSEANRLKTNFLSNMSHELRTPLNSVIALSGVLHRRLAEKITAEEKQYLDVIGRSGRNLLEMINEILDISRIESGREELNLEMFEMENLIQDLVDMLNPITDEKGIELKSEVMGFTNQVVGDEKKIRHIVQNLLSNAVKFTDQGWVGIVAKTDGHEIEITVSDTGIGIAKEHQEAIFEEFRQADSSTTRKFGGTGLGLAIVKRYVEFLGGTISLDSQMGQGSVFIVSLPIQSQLNDQALLQDNRHPRYSFDFAAATDTRIKELPKHKGPKRLLIVEDSEPAIVQLQDVFMEEGYEISVARDGIEAIQVIGQVQPDAIVLDLMMPRIDGFEVLKTIREEEATAHIPVLVLSAKHITKAELSELRHNHIFQLIQKGNVNLEELKAAVAEMIDPVEFSEAIIPQKAPHAVERPLVMVVEDNADNRMTAKAVLEDHFQVLLAEDGETAVNLATERIPDLILMDNALPGMDGVEAFRIIRNKEALAHIPVIALTASAMTSDREIFLAYGFDGFVPKPIIEEELLQAIRGALYGL